MKQLLASAGQLARCRVRPKAAELDFVTERVVRTQPPRYPAPAIENGDKILFANDALRLSVLGYRGLIGTARSKNAA